MGVAQDATSRSSIVSFPESRVGTWERGKPLHCESQKSKGCICMASYSLILAAVLLVVGCLMLRKTKTYWLKLLFPVG